MLIRTTNGIPDLSKMGELSHPILLVSLSPPEDQSRSVSPNSTTSNRELRGIRLFRAIGKRLSRRHNDDYDSDSEPSSSSESPEGQSDSGSGNNSPDSSKDSSDSTLRKVFNRLNLTSSSSRRSSDSNSDISSSSSKKKSSSAPKKILRQPVSYSYVRGLSGLPTIRVPRTTSCCSQSCCRCHSPGCGR